MKKAIRQRGQAAPLALVFLLVLCVGGLLVFNTGQVVNKKIQLTNAADAAAYSVAVEQARAWNFAAYMNRGRVANEVAIAQVVSLNSWVTQINVSAFNFAKLAEVVGVFFPPIEAVAAAFDEAVSVISQFRLNVLEKGSGPVIAALDAFDTMYGSAAYAVIEAASTESARETAVDVTKKNAPDAEVRPVAQAVLLGQLVKGRTDFLDEFNVPSGRGAHNVGGERYRNVVMESRDEFTRDREDFWLIIEGKGGTDLVDYDRWAAMDVNHVPLIDLPLGWGGAQALGDSSQPSFWPGINSGRGWKSEYENKNYKPYGGISRTDPTGMLVDGDPNGIETGGQKSGAYFSTYKTGLAQRYHDVKTDKATSPDGEDAGPIFTVEVQSAAPNARTSSAIGVGKGRMQLADKARSDQIRSAGSAQVYFNRPFSAPGFARLLWGKKDGKVETGSLFSPYWQARLASTPEAINIALQVP